MEAADVALGAAAKVTFKASTEVDEKFERAIEVLSLYEQDYFLPRSRVSNDHSSRFVYKLMAAAKEKDNLPSILINSLKEKLKVREELSLFLDRILILTPSELNENRR